MKRSPSAAVTRRLAVLRRWLRDTWISRVSFVLWLRDCRQRFFGPRENRRPKPPAFRADWLRFEPRWGPDDFLGMGAMPFFGASAAVLGQGLQPPVMALARGGEPAFLVAPTAAASAPAAFEFRPAEPFSSTAGLFGASPPSTAVAGPAFTPRAAAAEASAPQPCPPSRNPCHFSRLIL